MDLNIRVLMNRIAEVQLRLFTAQISYAYLNSLIQPPTPSRGHYTASELKKLQTELDGLVSHCEEATRLLARQTVANAVSETLLRGKVGQMERELDGVERIEDIVNGMVGRMTVAKDLLLLDMSKLDALGQILKQLGEKVAAPTQHLEADISNQPRMRDTETIAEIVVLQGLTGVRNVDDVRKILLKGNRLEQDLFESSIQCITDSLDET